VSSRGSSVRLTTTRLVLLGLAVAFGARVSAQSPGLTRARDRAPVVFVCEHGSVKSLVASVYFNRRAQERGLPYRAVAMGVAPDAAVPAPVRDGLRADGFDVADFVPQAFEASAADYAALVVSFDQDVTKMLGGGVRHLKWDDLPGVLADYPRGRDAIVRRVDALLDDLARGASP
jgi:arsenate reductase (thioredoxin)